jgi:hypothetical protein
MELVSCPHPFRGKRLCWIETKQSLYDIISYGLPDAQSSTLDSVRNAMLPNTKILVNAEVFMSKKPQEHSLS